MNIEHGVFVVYGVTKIKMSAKDLQLIADALEIVNPDTEKVERRARKLAASFLALSEYAATVK
jgi:hypothetical protein